MPSTLSPPRWLISEPPWLRLGVPLALTAAALASLATQSTRWPVWPVLLLGVWALVMRWRTPVLAFGGCGAVALALASTDGSQIAELCVFVALYNVAARASFLRIVFAAACTAGGIALVATPVLPGVLDRLDLITVSSLALASLLLGTTWGANRRYLESLQEQAHRLERERAGQEALTVAAERTRIARELHDIVAHGLTVVITMAQGAAANAIVDPPEAQGAMQQVAGVARQSLWEMRRLLDVLRDDQPRDLTPQPDLSQLDRLASDVRATGLDVRLTQSGDPHALGPGLEATLFRIVQEGLTNVIKHAREATRVTVELRYRADAVEFLIEDDGRHGAAAPAVGGKGLTGIRERVGMFDGALEVEPSPTGWRLTGRLRHG